MGVKWRATVEDLRRAPGRAELVDGRLVFMTPAGGRHGYASLTIAASLRAYAARVGFGVALGDNVGFRVALPNRQSFSPDAAFHLGPLTSDFLEGAPVFAAEIRSPEDYGPLAEARLAAKRADYLAAGTRVVWDVDLEHEPHIRAYGSDHPGRPREWTRGQVASAEPALPGWLLPVDDLFAN